MFPKQLRLPCVFKASISFSIWILFCVAHEDLAVKTAGLAHASLGPSPPQQKQPCDMGSWPLVTEKHALRFSLLQVTHAKTPNCATQIMRCHCSHKSHGLCWSNATSMVTIADSRKSHAQRRAYNMQQTYTIDRKHVPAERRWRRRLSLP